MQDRKQEPNYGNRPIEREGLLARWAAAWRRSHEKPAELPRRLRPTPEAAAVPPAPEPQVAVSGAATPSLSEVNILTALFKQKLQQVKSADKISKIEKAQQMFLLAVGVVVAVACAPLMIKHSIILSLYVAVPAALLAASRAHGRPGLSPLRWAGVVGFLAVGVFWAANLGFDIDEGELLHLPVTGKYITTEKRNHEAQTVYKVSYTLDIPENTGIHFAADASGKTETVTVSQGMYLLVVPGETLVSLHLRQGAFDMPWLSKVRVELTKPDALTGH